MHEDMAVQKIARLLQLNLELAPEKCLCDCVLSCDAQDGRTVGLQLSLSSFGIKEKKRGTFRIASNKTASEVFKYQDHDIVVVILVYTGIERLEWKSMFLFFPHDRELLEKLHTDSGKTIAGPIHVNARLSDDGTPIPSKSNPLSQFHFPLEEGLTLLRRYCDDQSNKIKTRTDFFMESKVDLEMVALENLCLNELREFMGEGFKRRRNLQGDFEWNGCLMELKTATAVGNGVFRVDFMRVIDQPDGTLPPDFDKVDVLLVYGEIV